MSVYCGYAEESKRPNNDPQGWLAEIEDEIIQRQNQLNDLRQKRIARNKTKIPYPNLLIFRVKRQINARFSTLRLMLGPTPCEDCLPIFECHPNLVKCVSTSVCWGTPRLVPVKTVSLESLETVFENLVP
jgi:hypothetical protein